MLKALVAGCLAAPARALLARSAELGPAAACQGEHALDRLVQADCAPSAPGPNHTFQYVFMISDLCRGGGGAPLRENQKDLLRSCGENGHAFFDEAKYAISTLQATGARYGITVLMHEGLPADAASLGAFESWLRERKVNVRYVPGKANDAHMYYYMKSYLWDMAQHAKVAFFDTDFLFLRNPDKLFQECRGTFCASQSVWTSLEAMTSHSLAHSSFLSSQYGALLAKQGRNAWNAGFFVVAPDAQRGAQVLSAWQRCEGAENHCLNQAVTGVQTLSPIYNLQHTELEGRSISVSSVPTVAVHGKVGHMTCEAIEKTFGQTKCGKAVN
mmetsp:Transcript_40030/g.127378  ORF Transcript_40030/g.127378 Transcript_40030/m.127378 type:complete len:328 (+) Transcript_40030:99-1082(+)